MLVLDSDQPIDAVQQANRANNMCYAKLAQGKKVRMADQRSACQGSTADSNQYDREKSARHHDESLFLAG